MADTTGNTAIGGTLTVTGDSTFDTSTLFVDSSNNKVGAGTTTPWAILSVHNTDGVAAFIVGSSTNTNLIVDANGYIGIGTESPTYQLDVVGSIGLDQYLYHNGDTDTFLNFTDDNLTVNIGNETLINLTEDGTQDIVKLGDGGDVDINLNDNMLIEGLTSKVGVGSTTPWATFSIDNNEGENAFVVGSSTNTNLKVDEDGKLTIGVLGSAIKDVLFGTCTVTIGSVTASSTAVADCTATGITTSHKVFVTPYITDPEIIFVSASSTAANTIQVSVYNTGAISGDINPTDNTWSWMAIE